MVPGWYNTNANRDYPFRSPASLSAGAVALPEGWLVDAGFTLHAGTGAQDVWLATLARSGSNYTATFTCPGVAAGLAFTFPVSAAAVTVRSASAATGGEVCDRPYWEGFLTVNDAAALAEVLPADGSLSGSQANTAIEPALVLDASRREVWRFGVANAERMRATNPEDCDELEWPFELEDFYKVALCLTGDIRLADGRNLRVEQDDTLNAVALLAGVGAGLGAVCEQPKLFPDEEKAEGRDTYDGALLCTETVRTINGAAGPAVTLTPGRGVQVVADPENNKVTVDVDFALLARCASPDE